MLRFTPSVIDPVSRCGQTGMEHAGAHRITPPLNLDYFHSSSYSGILSPTDIIDTRHGNENTLSYIDDPSLPPYWRSRSGQQDLKATTIMQAGKTISGQRIEYPNTDKAEMSAVAIENPAWQRKWSSPASRADLCPRLTRNVDGGI